MTALERARAANERHEFAEGERAATEALDAGSLTNAERADAWLQRGIAVLHLGRIDESIAHCQEGLKYVDDSAPFLHAELDAQLAVGLKQQGRRAEALEHALAALGVAQGQSSTEARQLQATLHNNIAVILLAQHDLDAAIRHFERGLEATADLGDADASRAIQKINLGRVLLRADRDDDAARQLSEGFALAEQLGHDVARIHAMEGLAVARMKQGRADEALTLIEPVVAHWDSQPDSQLRGRAYATRGEIEMALGHSGSLDSLQTALQIADQGGHAELKLLVRDKLALQAEGRRDFEAACRWHRELHALREERFDAMRAHQTAEIEARFQIEQQNRDLAAARDAAEAATRAKSSFLAVTSHELRTPLNAITGYTELLLDELDLDGSLSADAARSELEAILAASSRLLSLIERILTLASLEAGEEQLDCVDFAPNDIFLHAIHDASSAAASKNDTLVAELAIPGVMHSDPRQLGRVVHHLLENAVAFTTDGKITVRARRDADTLVFEVEDEGVGIDAAEVERLFQPFRQVDMSYTRDHEGLGLGLTLCAHHCRLLGGTIAAEPTATGSLFRVSLPWALDS